MKFRFSLLSLFLILSIQFSLALSLKEAQKKGLVTLKITENENSTHYYSPLRLDITNMSSTDLSLELENGVTLIPEDQGDQNFIVTDRLLVQLKPKERKEVEIFAMCIEQSDRAPSEKSSYSVGEFANNDLRKLSAFIETNKRFEPDAQFLMWDIADGYYPSESIDHFVLDEEGVVSIFDELGKEVRGIAQEIVELEKHKPKLMVSGQFDMSFTKPKNVHIAMFNKDNVIVKELYKNPATPVGKTSLNYEFNSYDYEEETYYVKLVMNGQVIMTRTIEMSY